MNPLLLIDFPGVPVFEDATVDPQILIVGKQKYSGCTQACAIKKHQESLSEYIPRHSITTSWQLIIQSQRWTLTVDGQLYQCLCVARQVIFGSY